MFEDPETWVAIAFIILMGVFAYMGVHRTALTALDHRAARIKAELDDARKLKDEAAKVLAEYKTRPAPPAPGREAKDTTATARPEPERIAADPKPKMEDFAARRTKSAESKIAM